MSDKVVAHQKYVLPLRFYPEEEAKLKEEAQKAGKSPSGLAVELVLRALGITRVVRAKSGTSNKASDEDIDL